VKVDAGGGLPVGAELPELLRDRLELERAFAGEPTASLVLFEGTDGKTYKSGYAPVRDEAAGRAVGVVVVEAEADFFRPLRALGRGFAGLLGVGLLLLGAAAVVTAAGLSAPLRRLMEAALRMGRGDLSTPVPPERTREIGTLAQELEAMRVQLEGRDRQLKMMLAGVAHEVRNPLGGMALFAGLLDEELSAAAPSMEEAKGHVARVRAELQYLTRIVEDFLAFAREQPLSLSELEGPALLSAAAAHLAGEAQERGVVVVVEAEAGRVRVDEGLVTAALVNLLKNALQASPSPGRVVLRGRREQGLYSLQVEDSGPGIPEASAARVFEPFFTTREKGTGLGLALARKIAEAHRGGLGLESRPGRTVLTLRLPAA
jgi:signal transduction histidine kinase